MRKRGLAATLAAAWALSWGCGAASDNAGANGFGGGADGGTNAPFADGGTLADGGGAFADAPPERETEGDYQSPVATGRFVWVANPTSGRVAYVDATTLEVHTVEAGNGPTYLVAVPDPKDDVALVMNVLSYDATLLRASGGQLSTTTFPIARGSNAWAVSADGRWAIAWTDSTKLAKLDPTQGFQDVSVIDLTGQKPATIVAVGYRPVKLGFSSDGARALAVTQDGISVIDLTQPSPIVIKNVAVSDNPLDDPGSRDVSVTPDGKYALIRRDGKSDVTVVAIDTGALTKVQLGSAVSDLDLSTAGDRALAILRDTSTAAILPIPAIASSPTAFTTVTITGQLVGSASLAKGGKIALLYTNAIPSERLTVLSLDTSQFHTIRLYAPILAALPADDAQNAVVVHDTSGDAGAHPAFSLVPLSGNLPAKIVGTPAPPQAVAISPSSDRVVVSVRDDVTKTYGVYLGKLPSLEVDQLTLASPPIAVGVVAGAGRAYVAQSHAEGRITFIDLSTGKARTLTGFELGSRVVDGSGK